MKFSILLVILNEEKMISRAIKSVIFQGVDFELLILDEGSTDKTKEVVESFKDERIKFIECPNIKMHERIEMGRKLATGDIIGNVSADDIFLPNSFKKIEKILENADWCVAPVIQENGEFIFPNYGTTRAASQSAFFKKDFMEKNNIRYEWEKYPNIADTIMMLKTWKIKPPALCEDVVAFLGIRDRSPIWHNKKARYFEMTMFRKEIND